MHAHWNISLIHRPPVERRKHTHCKYVWKVGNAYSVDWCMWFQAGMGGNNENQIQLVAEGKLPLVTLCQAGQTTSVSTASHWNLPELPTGILWLIINGGHFYSVVSHPQGWAHCALQDQQKCTHNTSKRIYEHYVVFLAHHTHTPAHTWVHWRNVMGWEEDRFWNHLLWYCL